MDLLTRIEQELRAEAAKLLAAADAISGVGKAGERSPRRVKRAKGARTRRSHAPKRPTSTRIKPAPQGGRESARERPQATLALGTSTKPDAPREDAELVHTTQAGERDG